MSSYHDAVLLAESVDGLNVVEGGVYVDVTFGGGGHSRRILERLGEGKLIAFDQDSDTDANTIEDERVLMVRQNFRYLTNFLKLYNALPIQGLLADLGVSSHQFDEKGRGFSIRFDARLDMRMNTGGAVDAEKVVNEYTEDQLVRIFRNYGEVPNARRLAKVVVDKRSEKAIRTVFDLKEAIAVCSPKRKEQQYLAKVFQAIRIEVNDELEALKELLKQSCEALAPGGRLVVISYHSLEDRLVKNFIRSGNFEGELEKDFYGNIIKPMDAINRKVIVPSDEEIARNPRARSAKLRIAVKK